VFIVERLYIGTFTLALMGCGGSVHDAVDASTDAVADAPIEASINTGDADASIDAPIAPIDAGTPISCDAGEYFVTVDDGMHTDVLRSGCEDSGLSALNTQVFYGPNVPSMETFTLGNFSAAAFIEACSSSIQLETESNADTMGVPAPGAAIGSVIYDNGYGVRTGKCTIQWTAVPLDGGPLVGGYASSLIGPDGGDAGRIAGTFCVLWEH